MNLELQAGSKKRGWKTRESHTGGLQLPVRNHHKITVWDFGGKDTRVTAGKQQWGNKGIKDVPEALGNAAPAARGRVQRCEGKLGCGAEDLHWCKRPRRLGTVELGNGPGLRQFAPPGAVAWSYFLWAWSTWGQAANPARRHCVCFSGHSHLQCQILGSNHQIASWTPKEKLTFPFKALKWSSPSVTPRHPEICTRTLTPSLAPEACTSLHLEDAQCFC